MPFHDDNDSLAPPFSPSQLSYPDEPSLAQLLESTQTERPAEVIQRVHENASVQYRISKRLKQQEFAYKIAEAQRLGDRDKLKSEKKKVDNHASAVASRVKQEFLVSSFESLVRKKMRESFRLAEVVKKHQSVSANKDAEIRMMSRRISQLTKEVAALNAHLVQEPPRASSDVHTRDETAWVSSDEFSLDSHPPTDVSGLDDLSTHPIPPCVQPQQGTVSSAEEVGSALSSYIDSVNSQAHEHAADPYKFELWEPLPTAVIAQRQISFNARLRPEEHDDSFNPVA